MKGRMQLHVFIKQGQLGKKETKTSAKNSSNLNADQRKTPVMKKKKYICLRYYHFSLHGGDKYQWAMDKQEFKKQPNIRQRNAITKI